MENTNLPNPPKKNKLLLVEPYSRSTADEVHTIRMLFLRNGWQVQKLSPSQKTYHEKGVLCIPNSGGINGCMSEFHDKDSEMPPDVPPQDQAVEWFRLNTLEYYVNKEMPILGIGYSAFLIFANVLQGKLNTGDDGISIGYTPHKIIAEDQGFFSFEPGAPICAGLYDPRFDEGLVVIAEQLLKNNGRGAAVMASKPTKPILLWILK